MTSRAYAKLNIFLKILGHSKGYHQLSSRFILYTPLFDTITFMPKTKFHPRFDIAGCACPVSSNTIYGAYRLLLECTKSTKLKNFFENHLVQVDKKIPQQAGLGGGSSDAAAFLHLCNDALDLKLSSKVLYELGMQVGSDVGFFVTQEMSANVSGRGEIIKPFDEDTQALIEHLEVFTPSNITCESAVIYKQFAKAYGFFKEDLWLKDLQKQKSLDILKQNQQGPKLNDLYAPAIDLHPALREYAYNGHYLSGSGSSIFRLQNL